MYKVVLFFSIYIFLTLTLTLLFRNEISEKYNQRGTPKANDDKIIRVNPKF